MENINVSILIDELKSEHRTIAETINEVNRLGIGTREGQEMLMAAKSSFLTHIKKEDERIYPLLYRAAENDPELKTTLDIYATDMNKISKAVLAFFEKYSYGDSGLEFSQDYGTLYTTLSLRIAKEEAVIYKKFDELDPEKI